MLANAKLKGALSAGVIVVGLAYPFLIYWGMQHLSSLWLCGLLLCFISLRFFTESKQGYSNRLALALSFVAVIILVLVDQTLAVKAYPVVVSLSFCLLFVSSLFFPPPLVERFARLQDPNLDAFGIWYCRKVTQAWIVFFILNASISTWTAVWASNETWVLYNGFLSYLLIGGFFAAEYGVRVYFRKKRSV